MQQILYSKYCLESSNKQDKQFLQNELVQLTMISKIQSRKKFKQGRGLVQEIPLSNQKAFIKSFLRGGLISQLIENKFLHTHFCKDVYCIKYRPFGELKILENLYAQGIPVPKPLAAYVKTSCFGLLYQGAIATEKIHGAKNLLSIIKESKDSKDPSLNEWVKNISLEAGKISKKILNAGIFHVDLHLGNVLLDQNNNVFIIDFDRAVFFNERQKTSIYKKTISRWLKSCKKYQVEEIAGKYFIEGFNNV